MEAEITYLYSYAAGVHTQWLWLFLINRIIHFWLVTANPSRKILIS